MQHKDIAACSLSDRKCVPCEGGVPKLTPSECQTYMAQLGGDWKLVDHHQLEKEYRFKDFAQALAFVNRASAVAEAEGHHPYIHLTWGYVKLIIWTHAIDGLSENDFILAAKTDAVL